MEAVTEILQADRATLFLYDDQSHELWSDIALGLDDAKEIRIPHDAGIAGSVFVSGETINIKDAYSNDRFNKAVDKQVTELEPFCASKYGPRPASPSA